MNIKLKTLLSLGVVSLVTATSAFPINAASKETCAKKFNCKQTKGYICMYINGKVCSVPTKPIYSHVSHGCGAQKPVTKPEVPEVKPDVNTEVPSTPVKPSTPSNKPVTKPDYNNNNNNNSNGNTNNDTSTSAPSTTPTGQYAQFQQEVLNLVNKERTSRGLKPLTLNAKLSNVATMKSQDMINKNYFDHTSPTYGSPFDMMNKFGISYRTAGENIAMGQTTPQQVMNSWMNSEGHRKNILNPNFTELGVGIASNGSSLYWTQMFIG